MQDEDEDEDNREAGSPDGDARMRLHAEIAKLPGKSPPDPTNTPAIFLLTRRIASARPRLQAEPALTLSKQGVWSGDRLSRGGPAGLRRASKAR